ncbi:MAG TPA: hypothetical protein VLL52_15565 [Anaerolineae bacterium]|nr:hypothetical protein [Anaerolineae bacterium]
MDLFQMVHGSIRWFVLIVAVVAVVKFAIGLVRGESFTSRDRALMGAFTGFVDLNVLLGIILWLLYGLLYGSWALYRIEHGVMMLIAVGFMHGTSKWRKQTDSKLQFRNSIIVIAVTFGLILMGVLRLPQGWAGF